jgi:hypothetical protein
VGAVGQSKKKCASTMADGRLSWRDRNKLGINVMPYMCCLTASFFIECLLFFLPLLTAEAESECKPRSCPTRAANPTRQGLLTQSQKREKVRTQLHTKQ